MMIGPPLDEMAFIAAAERDEETRVQIYALGIDLKVVRHGQDHHPPGDPIGGAEDGGERAEPDDAARGAGGERGNEPSMATRHPGRDTTARAAAKFRTSSGMLLASSIDSIGRNASTSAKPINRSADDGARASNNMRVAGCRI